MIKYSIGNYENALLSNSDKKSMNANIMKTYFFTGHWSS